MSIESHECVYLPSDDIGEPFLVSKPSNVAEGTLLRPLTQVRTEGGHWPVCHICGLTIYEKNGWEDSVPWGRRPK